VTRSSRRSAGFAFLLAIVVPACGDAEPDPEPVAEEATPADTVLVARDADAPAAEDPFRGFNIGGRGESGHEEKLLALRLQNGGTEDAVVFAEAGAGEVLLDSVPAGRWSRVDLLTHGPVVTLRTARSSGETIHRLELAAVPDSIVEVNVGDPAATP